MCVLLVQTPSVEGFTQEKVYPIGIVTWVCALCRVTKDQFEVIE